MFLSASSKQKDTALIYMHPGSDSISQNMLHVLYIILLICYSISNTNYIDFNGDYKCANLSNRFISLSLKTVVIYLNINILSHAWPKTCVQKSTGIMSRFKIKFLLAQPAICRPRSHTFLKSLRSCFYAT